MDADAASKKRKRTDGVGSSDVEVEGERPGETSSVAAAVPTKKAFDVNALKAKMAETKRKMEEMKAASQGVAQEKASTVTTTNSTSQAVSTSTGSSSVAVAPATSSAHARFLQEQQEKRAKEQKKQEKESAKPTEKAFDPSFDPRLKRATVERKSRPLVFLEAGELSKRAEAQNAKIQKMVEEKQSDEPKTETSGSTRRPRPAPTTETGFDWWDQPFIATESANSGNSMAVDSTDRFDAVSLKEDMITLLIHHPVLSNPAAEAPEPAPRPIMLTPEQERRLAKQKKRLELEKRREEVLLGIRPAEKGRRKLSNMVKVFSDAISDPTLVEQRVREEQALREGRHFARNAERQLTPEERKAKEAEKRKEDTSLSSTVAVFRILSLENSKNRFKVAAEVEWNFLSGVAVYSPEFVVLAVEGGPKAIARFTKKMLQKVPWTQPLPDPKEEEASSTEVAKEGSAKEKQLCYGKKISPEDNQCHLVWQGEVLRRSFTDFRFTLPHQGARAYLQSLNVGHYYDAAKNFVPNDVIV